MTENVKEEILSDNKESKKAPKEVKKTAHELVLEALNKDFGKGTVMSAGEVPRFTEAISTGSLKFDLATGVGGIPNAGCIIEFLGWESSGKSTFTLQTIANAQKQTGKRALLVDGEHSFDKKYAVSLGIDLSMLDITQPACGEDAYNIAEKLMDTKMYCICVIDSQTSLKPKKVVNGEVGDSHLGLEARMMGDAVHKMLGASKRAGIPVIFVSQMREKIGVMFGSPETTSGGHALKFYAHMRVEIRKSIESEGGEAVANKTKVKVIKNKFAPPFGTGEEIYIIFGKGVDRKRELLDLAVELNVVQKSGSWYAYEENKIGQGLEKVKEFLEDNPELMVEIEEKTLNLIRHAT